MNARLRHVTDDDHEWLVELHNDPLVLHNIVHPEPITLESHLKWWASVSRDVRQARKICEIDGARIGFAKFYDIDLSNKHCVLGADIHRDYRGRGYAKPMWLAMLDHAFGSWDLNRVSLTVAEYNEIGLRVYRGVGFREEGRLTQAQYRDGVFHDQICMYLLREDWTPSRKDTL